MKSIAGLLPRMEHDRWMAARKQAGVPTARNRTARTHPGMRLGRGVSEHAKEKDRMFVQGLLTLLEAEGLAIVRTPECSLAILLNVVKPWHSGRRYAPAGLIEYLDAGGPVVPVAPARHRATPAPPRKRERDRANKPALVQSETTVGRMRWRPSRVDPRQAELRARRSEWCSLSPGVY